MTTHPEDAMTREQAPEEAADLADARALAMEQRSRGDLGSMFAAQSAADFREFAKHLRALTSTKQEPSPAADAEEMAPIEADPFDPTREYIPLPAQWEIQTKGKGSSYRLLDRKTNERMMIMSGDTHREHDFVTRMAKEIHAALRRYAGEWRPIETAPKEPHSTYLGWCEFGDPRSPDGEARIITLDYNGFPYAFGCKQTVRWWMPLPESPAARASGEKGGAK